MREAEPVLMLISDLHLSHRCPAARAEGDDGGWYEYQRKVLEKVAALSCDHGVAGIVCAGDIFDRWDSPPELINFALRHMPTVYAVPGQHDLPHHNYEDIHKSAYWTLVKAGKIINLRPGIPRRVRKIDLHGFPWGTPLEPLNGSEDALQVAVVHAYIWSEGHEHPGAKPEDHVDFYSRRCTGYHAALFGDNHRGFQHPTEGCWIYNHGTTLRRRSDEKGYQPTYGILHENGVAQCHPLHLPEEKWVAEEDLPDGSECGVDTEELVDLLRQLGDHALSFRESALRFLQNNKVGDAVQKKVIEWLEKVRPKK